MEFLNEINLTLIADKSIATLVYCASALILLLVGKFIYQLLNRNINVNSELVIKDNFAFSIQYVGYLLGLLLSIGGAIVGESDGLRQDLVNIGIYGGLGLVFLNLASFISDKIILRKFKIAKEVCEDRNEGVAVVAAANYIASGLIVLGLSFV